MFPLFGKNLLFHNHNHHPSRYSSQVRTFLIRFPFSSPPQTGSRSVKVSVWWDIDKCGVPSGVSYWNVSRSIMAALRDNSIKGRIEISAYHRFSTNLNDFDKLALTSTGIRIHPIESDYDLTTRLLDSWIATNHPPAHLFLKSHDNCHIDFSGMLHRLRMNNYNILIACPGRGSPGLRSSATIMWHWSSMLKGKDLTGKHFNHYPDCPIDSFYGYSHGPFEDFLSAVEEEEEEEEPTQSAEILEYLKSGEVANLENSFSKVEEPTSSEKQITTVLQTLFTGHLSNSLRV